MERRIKNQIAEEKIKTQETEEVNKEIGEENKKEKTEEEGGWLNSP